MPSKKKIAEILPEQGFQIAEVAEGNQDKDIVRSEIGVFYVKAFVLIIAGTLAVAFFRGYNVSDVKDILLAISGVLSGPLGFIIGFYFKDEFQNK